MRKFLSCIVAAVICLMFMTANVNADEGEVWYSIGDDDYEVILDEGCMCGEDGECKKPSVTTAPEESKPVTVKTDVTAPKATTAKVTEKKPEVTTAKVTDPKPKETTVSPKTEPIVTTTKSEDLTPASTDEPFSFEGGSLDFGSILEELFSMFGDMDLGFDMSDFGNMGGFGTDMPLTPDGNMSLLDDIYQNEEEVTQSKQFITVQTKAGNTFYLIIDRSKDGQNVYFLNLVDEADLMALMETETEAPAEQPSKPSECICKDKDKCEMGAVNSECEVCRMDIKKCLGKEKVKEEVVAADPEKETPKAEKKALSPALLLLPVLALVGGGAYWFIKMRKPKSKNAPNPDDYDFDEDDDSGDGGEDENIDDEDDTSDSDDDEEAEDEE